MESKEFSIVQNSRKIRHVEKFETIKAVSDRYDEIMELQKTKFCYPEPIIDERGFDGKYIFVWTEHLR